MTPFYYKSKSNCRKSRGGGSTHSNTNDDTLNDIKKECTVRGKFKLKAGVLQNPIPVPRLLLLLLHVLGLRIHFPLP